MTAAHPTPGPQPTPLTPADMPSAGASGAGWTNRPQWFTDSTLHLLPSVEPRSDEWYDVRRGMVTASAVGQLITAKTIKPASNDNSRGLTTLLAAERITGYTEPTYTSDDMMRGIIDEPLALDVYSKSYAPVTRMGFMIRENRWKLGYSPDALVGNDGAVEVKSRRQKVQLATILNDAVPTENLAQLQCGLLVSGRQWIDYVSYSGGMPMFVKRVFPSSKWFDAIITAVEQFEQTVAEMIANYGDAIPGMPMTERSVDVEMVIP
jgi:hypothetical protein